VSNHWFLNNISDPNKNLQTKTFIFSACSKSSFYTPENSLLSRKVLAIFLWIWIEDVRLLKGSLNLPLESFEQMSICLWKSFSVRFFNTFGRALSNKIIFPKCPIINQREEKLFKLTEICLKVRAELDLIFESFSIRNFFSNFAFRYQKESPFFDFLFFSITFDSFAYTFISSMNSLVVATCREFCCRSISKNPKWN